MKPTGVFPLYRTERVLALVAVSTALVIGASISPTRSPVEASSSHLQQQSSTDTGGHGPRLTDQTLTWNTFLGDNCTGLAVDGNGNVYVVGDSRATWGFPVRAFSGNNNAFVAKLDSAGNVIWNTFLGGGLSDSGKGVAVDGSGNIYVTGSSGGSWGSPLRAYSGGLADSFAAKLDSSGNLIWNTFLGGSGGDYPTGIAVDVSGNLYVVGGTSEASWGSPLRAYSGNSDAFAAKVGSSGNLIWNTFLGGSDFDSGSGVAVDASGNLYVVGGSQATWGAPVRAFNGQYDAFAARLNSSGSLTWSTFLGGSLDDGANAVAVDPNGNVAVVGFSNSTWGSPIRALSGSNAFAAKLDSGGNLTWNTFLGSPSGDYGWALAVDGSGSVYVGGRSLSTWGVPVRAYSGDADAFAAKLDSAGNLAWNTFLGGGANDFGYALAVDGSGNVYVGGASLATWGAPVRPFSNTGGTAFVAKVPAVVAPTVIQFSSPTYSVNEGTPQVNIAVTRSGDTTGSAIVSFATSDRASSQDCSVVNGKASFRCDYLPSIGALQLAAGEISKSVSISIVDDAYAEGNESFTVSLSNASGASLGVQATATVTIIDNDSLPEPNPLDSPNQFVRQQYLDFLNREPDASGFAFWTNEIISCGADQRCLKVKRVNVSAAFYLSIEFQQTGYLVERVYKAAYGDTTGNSQLGTLHLIAVPAVKLTAFLADIQEIGQGVVVNQGNWQQQLENNKQAFMQEFVLRPEFTPYYPTSQTPTQFVNLLFTHAGLPQSGPDYTAAINEFGAATTSADLGARSRALRRVAENSTFVQQELNRAFVLMEYFGYLRRNPDNFPDSDYTGYDFWLTKLNQFNGNYQDADMVKAFITSSEYRQRFGQ